MDLTFENENISNSTENESHDNLFQGIYEHPVPFAVMDMICLVTLLSNSCYLVYLYKRDRKAFRIENAYVLLPCYNGLFFAIFDIPFQIYFVLIDYYWYIGLPLCSFWFITSLGICAINIYAYLVLTYIRFTSFRRRFQKWTPKQNAIALAAIHAVPIVIWTLFVTVYMIRYPPMIDDCQLTVDLSIAYAFVLVVLILPLAASVGLNVYNIYKLNRKKCKLNVMKSANSKEKRAIYKLLTVQILFVICWLPYISTIEMDPEVLSDDVNTVIYFMAYSYSYMNIFIQCVFARVESHVKERSGTTRSTNQPVFSLNPPRQTSIINKNVTG